MEGLKGCTATGRSGRPVEGTFLPDSEPFSACVSREVTGL